MSEAPSDAKALRADPAMPLPPETEAEQIGRQRRMRRQAERGLAEAAEAMARLAPAYNRLARFFSGGARTIQAGSVPHRESAVPAGSDATPFERLGRHHRSLIKATLGGVITALSLERRVAPLVFGDDGRMMIESGDGRRVGDVIAQAKFLASFARAAMETGAAQGAAPPVPAAASRDVGAMSASLRRVTTGISTTVLVSMRLSAEEAAEGLARLGRFFSVGARTVVAGVAQGATHARAHPFATLSAVVVAGAAAAAAGFGVHPPHMDMGVLAHAMAHAATPEMLGSAPMDLASTLPAEHVAHAFSSPGAPGHLAAVNLGIEHATALGQSPAGQHLVQLASTGPMPLADLSPLHAAQSTAPDAPSAVPMSELMIRPPATHVQDAAAHAAPARHGWAPHRPAHPHHVSHQGVHAAARHGAARAGLVTEAGQYSAVGRYASGVADHAEQVIGRIEENLRDPASAQAVSSDFLDHVGRGSLSAADQLNNMEINLARQGHALSHAVSASPAPSVAPAASQPLPALPEGNAVQHPGHMETAPRALPRPGPLGATTMAPAVSLPDAASPGLTVTPGLLEEIQQMSHRR